jgi:signal transduction histidine kinase
VGRRRGRRRGISADAARRLNIDLHRRHPRPAIPSVADDARLTRREGPVSAHADLHKLVHLREEWPANPAWARSRSWLTDHPTLLDSLLVLLLEVWALASIFHQQDQPQWWALVLSQFLLVPLIVRRRFPWHVFLFVASAAAVQWLTDARLAADVAVLIALYTVAAHCSRRRALVAAGTVELGVALASIRFAPAGDGVVASLVFLSGMVAAGLFSGTTLQTRRQFLAALTERAVRLERERDQQARLAATAERTRIARELHDVIAHSLSVIITLADAAVISHDHDPAQAKKAMSQVAATGRGSMTEMRRLLGILRDDNASGTGLAPQPGLADIAILIEEVRGAGLPVELAISGIPQTLSETAESTIFRIIQESLTNTLKHANSPTHARIEIHWSQAGVTVEITDDGDFDSSGTRGSETQDSTDSGSSPEHEARHGIIGMRERASLFGGTVQAGPAPRGGWCVHAKLPMRAAS